VLILKGVKVICFDTLLQVLILNGLGGDGKWRRGAGQTAAKVGREENGRGSDPLYTGRR
jgi:hypothetical protein